ncbi:MAG: TolC family protein [Oligoflexia bacterium]|nr:TolC family protein [Oligoflexia bacterium]
MKVLGPLMTFFVSWTSFFITVEAKDVFEADQDMDSTIAATVANIKHKNIGLSKLLQPLDIFTVPSNVKKTLTRKELFELLANQGLEIKVIQNNTIEAEEMRKQYNLIYLPQLKLSSGYAIQKSTPKEIKSLTKTTNFGIDLTGQYYGGLTYNLNFPKISKINTTTEGGGDSTDTTNYSWDLGAGLGINLLKGSYFFVGMIPKYKEEIAHTSAIENIRTSIMNTVTNAQSAFIDVFQKQTQLKIAELSLHSTNVLLSDLNEMYKVGESDDFSILKVKLQVTQGEIELISARKAYSDSHANLRTVLNIKDSMAVIYPDPHEFSKIPEKPTLSLQDSLEIAKANRSDYKAAVLAVKTAKMSIDEAFSSILPSLDLSLTRSYNRTGTELIETGKELKKLNNPTTTIAINFSYPLTENSDNFSYRATKRNYSQSEINLQKAENDLAKDVANAIFNVEIIYKKLDMAKVVRSMSEKKLQNEYIKYKVESGKIRDVIDAQSEVNNSRILEVNTQIEVITVLNSYYTAIGRLPPEVEFRDFL